MKEYINDVPVFSLEEMNTSDGAYGVKESGIVRAYLKNLHKLGYLVPGDPILPIIFQAAGGEYRAAYDGYCYVRFEEKGRAIMFVELDRIKAEYDKIYPPKETKPVDTYDKSILKTMISLEEDKLKMFGRHWLENEPYKYTSHTMALEAYRMLMKAHEVEG